MPVNPRRQTLAGAGSKAAPPLPPSNNSSKPSSAASSSNGGSGGGSSNGSVVSDSRASAARRRVPMSRKSMIPRCATSDNVNRENNNRAPSPLRPTTASGNQGTTGAQQASSGGIAVPSPRRSPRRHNSSRPPAMRKSMGGAILQHGGDAAGLTPHHPNRAPSPARNRRVSLAPTMTSTSSSSSSSSGGATATSGGGTVPGSSSNIDPRDIKDRSYLQTAIRKMVSYLTSRGYADASSLNVKQLVTNGPSGRDFQNIMTFLFRRVDPTFNSTSATTSNNNQRSDEVVIKFEDEVSMAYRCLGYPFPISKTGLVAVGSPHTWPALIAAIDWLVDVLTIRDEEEVHDWGPDDITAADSRGVMTLDASLELIDSQFHHFLRKSIGAFLKENDEECAELEGVLLDTFQKDHLRVEENLTALDNECELMKEEIASLSAEVDGYVIYMLYILRLIYDPLSLHNTS